MDPFVQGRVQIFNKAVISFYGKNPFCCNRVDDTMDIHAICMHHADFNKEWLQSLSRFKHIEDIVFNNYFYILRKYGAAICEGDNCAWTNFETKQGIKINNYNPLTYLATHRLGTVYDYYEWIDDEAAERDKNLSEDELDEIMAPYSAHWLRDPFSYKQLLRFLVNKGDIEIKQQQAQIVSFGG